MKRTACFLSCVVLTLAACTSNEPDEPDVVVSDATETIEGKSITTWTEAWWAWTFAVPAAQNPELVLDQDCAVGQDEDVYFVPAYDGATTYRRTCEIPEGMTAIVPLWVIINDYPCPDPAFEPAEGQSLEEFLRQGAIEYNDLVEELEVMVDGESIDPGAHRHTTGLFEFQAEASLVGALPDPCLNGMRQSGVSDGTWLAVTVADGEHEVSVTGIDPGGEAFEHTYVLTAVP